jgi:hypothetical protein
MDIPKDITERLLALDESPEDYADLVRLAGADCIRRFIDGLAEADRLSREWAPKLRDFAVQCRIDNPCPDIDALSVRDRAKLPIFESLIINSRQLPNPRKKSVFLCSIPVFAIPLAMALWPGKDERTVLLTADEISRWGEIYKHPEESFQWFVDYWWCIEDTPRPNSLWTHAADLTTPEGTKPWLAISGMSSSSIQCSADAELWAWDGKQAQFVRDACCFDS